MNPELFRISLTAVGAERMDLPPGVQEAHAKVMLADSLAATVLRMDRFLDTYVDGEGNERRTLELYVLTRSEINAFMRSVADATREYDRNGRKLS